MSNRPVPVLVTHAQLLRVFPKLDPAIAPLLNETMDKYQITNKKRIAAFIAQAGHECVSFRRFEENLNYSADGLHATFPKYFPTLASAQPYHRQPQKIANKVYAGRMGNTGPNDGYTFRGRGAIQLTGKSNYSRFAADFGMDLTQAVAFLSTLRGAILSAGWFWNGAGLNALADAGNIKDMTKRINGGYIGLNDRTDLYNALLRVL